MDKKKEWTLFKTTSISISAGFILIVIGIIAFFQRLYFAMGVFEILAIIFFVHSLLDLFRYFTQKRGKPFFTIMIMALTGVGMFFYTDIPIYLSIILFALYITINGLARFLVYWEYKQNKVTGRMMILFLAILFFVNGITTLVSPRLNANQAIQIVAVYAILLGIGYVLDGVLLLVSKGKKEIWKRNIRVSLPVFITTLLPKIMMDFINNIVEQKPLIGPQPMEREINLEIFIHASGNGYGQIGHCDICLDGKVISYGNYDHASTKFFEMMGDGVLVISNKEQYLRFCIQDSQKTIFGYGLHLRVQQLKAVRDALATIQKDAYEWFPPAYFDVHRTDYASRMSLEIKAQYFKFYRGKFKNYFVFGCNCVLLVEILVGRVGHNIINLHGIISPGRYQEYLEKEYYQQGIVVSRTVYNKELLGLSK